MEPPGLIKLEKEIEQEETLSAPSPSPSPSSKSSGKKSTGNLLDDAVSVEFTTKPPPPSQISLALMHFSSFEFILTPTRKICAPSAHRETHSQNSDFK